MMKKKYPKNHPLWPVWDLQKQILKKGGTINRYSDLLSFFEAKSLYPKGSADNILMNLCMIGDELSSNITIESVYYKKVLDESHNIDHQYIIVPKAIGIPKGFTTKNGIDIKILNLSLISIENKLKDNQWFYKNPLIDRIITFDDKYIDILRLIKNGYEPKTYEMRSNKTLIPAIIIAAGLIISAFIYAYSQRYEIRGSTLRIDKWTGTIERMEYKK